MPYEILTFFTTNAKYQRERFTFKCRNFDIEIDLSAFINIHIYINSKFIVLGNVWYVAMLESKQIRWDLNAVVM